MTMIDFHGYLLDPTEIVCVTPMRGDGAGWQFFAMHFRGGGTETFTLRDAGDRGKFISLVRHARFDHGVHRMVDFSGYLVDLSEVVCVTSMRKCYTGSRYQQLFIVHFRGGSVESFARHRDKFVGLVKNAMLDQVMRQDTKDRMRNERH